MVDVSAPGDGYGVTIYETHGAALCELIEHLPTRGHAANGCEVLVTIDLDALLTGVGAAGLDSGVAITAGEARRLACNAGLVPAVLGGDSMPLDLGRLRRLHSRTQRRALSLIHDTCAVAGCQRPFAWCEIHHHRRSWGKGDRPTSTTASPSAATTTAEPTTPASTSDDRPDGDWAFHRRT